jgi:hypothetical protein
MAAKQKDAHVDDYLQVQDLVLLREEEAAIEASIAAANHAVDSYPVGSHEWEEAAIFLREIEEQDKQQQQEESCNRWL